MRISVQSDLSRINVPVLVVAGRYDLITQPDRSKELATALPQSRLVMMEHSGHFPFFEENYLFTEWVRQFMMATTGAQDDRTVAGRVSESSGSH
jgi:pimeloyl-ACP methyl ester carboxylesterase